MRNHRATQRRATRGAFTLALLVTGGMALGGCDGVTGTTAPEGPAHAAVPASIHDIGVSAVTAGGGYFDFFGFPWHFAFNAVQRDPVSGAATGNWQYAIELPDGVIDLRGRVSCMTTNAEHPGRAWIGGVITVNRSTHPAFTDPTSEVGADAWFRVVDVGNGAVADGPDRVTRIFTDATAPIGSSEEFCEVQLLFEGALNDVIRGNVEVRVR